MPQEVDVDVEKKKLNLIFQNAAKNDKESKQSK